MVHGDERGLSMEPDKENGKNKELETEVLRGIYLSI